MKTMKKIFALALALMLVFSLALTANAETLTVDGALKGAKYELYQMATVEQNETTGSILYYSTEAWEGFWTTTGATWFNYNSTTKQVTEKSDANMAAAAKAAKAYAAANNTVTATKTATATGEETPSASFANVADGYYLMTSSKGSLCTMITVDGKDKSIAEKNKQLPNITKAVDDEQVAIGDTATFTLTVNTGENHNNEMAYVIHDNMSSGLSLNQSSIVVKYKDSADATEKTLNLNTDYTVNVPGTETGNDTCTFEIVFTDKLTTKANGVMTVTYTALVNGTAGDKETNKAAIADATGRDDSDVVEVTTTEFTLNKTDGTTTLAGAKFELYKGVADAEGEISYVQIQVAKNEDGTYRPAVSGDTQVLIEAGSVDVKGVDADVTYYVKETEAPAGYVKIDDFKVVKDGVVTVVNVKGEELPETGGMGTTLFYTVGGLMVAAAVVLLVSKKRMSAM